MTGLAHYSPSLPLLPCQVGDPVANAAAVDKENHGVDAEMVSEGPRGCCLPPGFVLLLSLSAPVGIGRQGAQGGGCLKLCHAPPMGSCHLNSCSVFWCLLVDVWPISPECPPCPWCFPARRLDQLQVLLLRMTMTAMAGLLMQMW
jgi:hypothetical protein